jgi:hypothetical protein
MRAESTSRGARLATDTGDGAVDRCAVRAWWFENDLAIPTMSCSAGGNEIQPERKVDRAGGNGVEPPTAALCYPFLLELFHLCVT